MSPRPLPPLRAARHLSRKLRKADVIRLLGSLSETTFAKVRNRADFPRPFKFHETSRPVWDEREILEWIEQQREQEAGDAA